MEKAMTKNIEWLGHASFRITSQDGKIIYIDPWKLKSSKKKADLIFITHDHFDHLSPEDVEKISKPDTEIITTPDSAKKVSGKVKTVKPGDKIDVKGVPVEVVPAYNIHQDRLNYHPKKNNWVGFIITVDGIRIYHPGDTDEIPEMSGLKPDVLLLPCGGTYTMDAKEAVEAAKKIEAGLVIPMHFGDVAGSLKDAEYVSKSLPGKVNILKIVE